MYLTLWSQEYRCHFSLEYIWQTYCEEDWYVGACSRADAEHALHLVNKVSILIWDSFKMYLNVSEAERVFC